MPAETTQLPLDLMTALRELVQILEQHRIRYARLAHSKQEK
jgi:hypothetical protein